MAFGELIGKEAKLNSFAKKLGRFGFLTISVIKTQKSKVKYKNHRCPIFAKGHISIVCI